MGFNFTVLILRCFLMPARQGWATFVFEGDQSVKSIFVLSDVPTKIYLFDQHLHTREENFKLGKKRKEQGWILFSIKKQSFPALARLDI